MRMTTTTKALFISTLLGCGPLPELDEDPGTGMARSPITNASPTSGSAFAVRLSGLPPGRCSGFVLSQHYVVTAAHCLGSTVADAIRIEAGQNGEQVLYDGVADLVVHPNWVSDASDSEAFDVGIIHLRGNGLSATNRIQIYAGPETPWTSTTQTFSAVGYGIGSNAGGRQDCPREDEGDPDLEPFGTKRRGLFSFVNQGAIKDGVWQGVNAKSGVRTLCSGDSGGPWVLTRGGGDYAIAVSSRSRREPGEIVRGSRVEPKFEWMRAVAQWLRPALSCTLVRDHRFTPQINYWRCSEVQ